jgi:hypothetical protein
MTKQTFLWNHRNKCILSYIVALSNGLISSFLNEFIKKYTGHRSHSKEKENKLKHDRVD